jgi:hypothetical protein
MPSKNGRNTLPAGDTTGRPDASAKTRARGTRTPERARRTQRQAAVEAGEAEEVPGLGSINRHLTQVLEQLAAAHRILGRVAAERDALRQQLADLQGVPVEDIVIPSVGESTEGAPVPDESGPQPDAALAETPENRIDRIRRRLPRIRRRLPSR